MFQNGIPAEMDFWRCARAHFACQILTTHKHRIVCDSQEHWSEIVRLSVGNSLVDQEGRTLRRKKKEGGRKDNIPGYGLKKKS